jgi:hypothetical protein
MYLHFKATLQKELFVRQEFDPKDPEQLRRAKIAAGFREDAPP